MEISNKAINSLKLISRINKYLCPSTSRMYNTIFVCYSFQCSCACSSNSNNSAAISPALINHICIFLVNHIKFRMHMVFKNIFNLNRSESSKTNM